MIANLLLTYQASVADYGGCVILYRLPVGCGKAEIRCYDCLPRSLGPSYALGYGSFARARFG